MKSAGITIKGGARRALVLMAGLGTAAALVLAPAAAGISGATQPPTAPPATTTTMTTVVTNGTWTATSTTPVLALSPALVECPYSTYKTIPGATWIWGNFKQTGCQSSPTGPGTAPVGTVTLSTTFSISGTPTSATLTVAADNGASVYINNTWVATLAAPATPNTHVNFHTGFHYTVTGSLLMQGTNTITIVGTNMSSIYSYNPAGVIAKLSVTSVLTLTTKSQCKHTGWMQWTTPTFTNQGDCVSYLVSHGNDPVNG